MTLFSRPMSKWLGTLLGLALLAWLVLRIGVEAIATTLANASPRLAIAAVALHLLGLGLRYLKVRIYTPEFSATAAADLFLISRVGGEVSAALYLTPLLKADFRSARVASYVVVDRLLEVGMTVLLATVAVGVLWTGPAVLHLALAVFTLELAVILAALAVPLHLPVFALRRLQRGVHAVDRLRDFLLGQRANLPRLLALTLGATLLDMLVVVTGFAAIGVRPDPWQVPVVWALGASVGVATFLGVGPAEVAWVYLFRQLFGVAESATGSMIILTRTAGVAALTATLVAAGLWRRRQPVSSPASSGQESPPAEAAGSVGER